MYQYRTKREALLHAMEHAKNMMFDSGAIVVVTLSQESCITNCGVYTVEYRKQGQNWSKLRDFTWGIEG